MFVKMALTWDGSEIVGYDLELLQDEFCRLTKDGHEFYGYYKKTKENKLLALVDELKPLFSVIKTGSHTYGEYIIYRAMTIIRDDEIYIRDYKHIKEKYLTPTVMNQIKNILIFRYLFNISRTTESMILIRKTKTYSAISFNDMKINTNNAVSITDTLKRKYLKNTSINNEINTITSYTGSNSEDIIIWYRDNMESIVKRVYPNGIYIVSIVMDKIMNHFHGL